MTSIRDAPKSSSDLQWVQWELELLPQQAGEMAAYRCRIYHSGGWFPCPETSHENRCMAILLACHAAHTATKEQA